MCSSDLDRGDAVIAAERLDALEVSAMPPWAAHMTMVLGDSASVGAFPTLARRYASLARRWHALDSAAWERARQTTLLAALSEARAHVDEGEVKVLELLDSVAAWVSRGSPALERWALRATANALVTTTLATQRACVRPWAIAAASHDAASAASLAIRAVSDDDQWAAAYALRSAALLASWAARAASQTERQAVDRIVTAWLDAVEAEL